MQPYCPLVAALLVGPGLGTSGGSPDTTGSLPQAVSVRTHRTDNPVQQVKPRTDRGTLKCQPMVASACQGAGKRASKGKPL